MKKLITIAALVLFCAAALSAQNYRDGFYFAQDKDFVNNQKNQVVLEVKGGKIAAANWNILSLAAGAKDLKNIAASGSVPAAATWASQAAATEQYLVSSQDTKAKSVAGGPANVKPFFDLVTAALKDNAIARGSYSKDGWYYAEATAADGYQTRNTVLITVINGTIVDVLWNGILMGMPASINPSKQITSRAKGYPMTGAKRLWNDQADRTSAALVRANDPDKLKAKADGTADGISGVSVQIKEYLVLVKQALAQAK